MAGHLFEVYDTLAAAILRENDATLFERLIAHCAAKHTETTQRLHLNRGHRFPLATHEKYVCS